MCFDSYYVIISYQEIPKAILRLKKGFKMRMIKINTQLIISIIAVVALLTSHSFAALINITPTSTDVNVGNNVTVDIVVSEFAVNEKLSAFDIDLGYDSSVLALSIYNLTSGIGSLTAGELIDLSTLIAPGQLNLSGLSLLENFSFQESAFKLASVTFSAITEGTSALTLTVNALGNAFGEPLYSSLTIKNGSVNSVPEPSTVILFCTGLFLLAIVSLRKRVY
jgi:hypothetical protein